MPKSGNQINSGIPTKLNTSFYDKDKFNHPSQFVQRKFKDPIHFMHNLFDLLTHTPDLIRVYFGRAISPGFREMIMLTVAVTNDCNFWTNAHSRFGRIAGLRDEKIQLLGHLKKEDFDEQVWVALNWVRTYVLFEGNFPDKSVDETFCRVYPLSEQKAIFATLKLMLFFNMLFNVFDKKGSRLLRS